MPCSVIGKLYDGKCLRWTYYEPYLNALRECAVCVCVCAAQIAFELCEPPFRSVKWICTYIYEEPYSKKGSGPHIICFINASIDLMKKKETKKRRLSANNRYLFWISCLNCLKLMIQSKFCVCVRWYVSMVQSVNYFSFRLFSLGGCLNTNEVLFFLFFFSSFYETLEYFL